MKQELGIAGKLAHTFLNSKLTPLFIAASLALGAFAIAIIPREEEPQILVPMLDITTAMPGASPAEVEERVTLPIENLVHQISGVEYVYSTSAPGQSLVIVRFLVGTPQEDALIKVYSKLYSNFDRMPPGVSQPIIKARSIDDVPILALTLWGEHYDGYQLRAIAAEMQHNIAQVTDVSETTIIGGLPRTMRVILDGHRRASASRQCHGTGRQLCGEQSGSPRGCGQYLHQPRGFGGRGGGRSARAAGLSARRC
jgi:multidrug efflux pump subunit AcrB